MSIEDIPAKQIECDTIDLNGDKVGVCILQRYHHLHIHD